MRRLRGGTEARLHGSLTAGVGGHIDAPFRVPGCIEDTLHREWDEEVHVSESPEFEWLGVVNDDSVEVGQYHVGLVYLVRLPAGADVRVGEPHKLEGWWESPAEALARGAALETWSTFVLRELVARGE
jgi:predicted NUDIX family phosphoesterase